MIESSYNQILAGHQIFVRNSPTSASFKRRRFRVTRCSTIYRESLTIRMSADSSADNSLREEVVAPVKPPVPFEELQHEKEKELEAESEEIRETVDEVAKHVPDLITEHRSRDSSEGDLVHVSEFSSINNGGSKPDSGEATPIGGTETQQVDLKFERRDSQQEAKKPHLGVKQRRDVKEPGQEDDVEDTIQVVKTTMLTKKKDIDEKSKKKRSNSQQLLNGVSCAAGIGLVAIFVGVFLYYKYR